MMKTKYPILLVHGIILKDVRFFKSFGNIPKILRKEGFVVYTSTNDGVGTIENNARQIKQQIKKIMKLEKCDKVNIIAHSKGGLDCKYMITNLDMEDNVASLTTLCTPHKGSKMADQILSLPKWIVTLISKFLNICYRFLGDKKPNVLRACKQLKENSELDVNLTTNKVYCQSYSAVLKRSKDDALMAIPHMILKKIDNDVSDGLVSKESSKFGEYKGECLDFSLSHTEIVDLMGSKKEKSKVYEFYIDLCEDLATRGF